MGVSQKWWGFPPKWMVKIMENPIKMDDFGGTTIFVNIHNMGATPKMVGGPQQTHGVFRQKISTWVFLMGGKPTI